MPYSNMVAAIGIWSTSLLMSMIIGGITIWAYKRKKPMPFWTGSEIEPEEIANIPAYNRANILMWAVYITCIALTGVVMLFNFLYGMVAVVAVLTIGVIILIRLHKKFYIKYQSASGRYRIEI